MICIIFEKSIFENYSVQKSDCLNFFVTAKVFGGKIWKFDLICAWTWTLKESVPKNCFIKFASTNYAFL